MRFRHPDGTIVHLAYCTNVHQAEDLDGVLAQLGRYAEPVRERLGVDSLGLGLWLARDVATALAAGGAARLRAELSARGLEVVTLNGFPYRGFHAPVVKKAVYSPDWSSAARLDYTVDLARLLAALLPGDALRGSVSTLPLGWRDLWLPDRQQAARRHLRVLAGELAKIAAEQGRAVRVGFEPEPGCVIETTEDAVRWLGGVDTEWLGVCLDACHLAVAFEEPRGALSRLRSAGLPVVKTQVSCALHIADPAAARASLAAVAEPRFLHQVRERGVPAPQAADDLDEALDRLPGRDPWRVHFHVPIHRDILPIAGPADGATPLATTQPDLVETLRALLGGPRALTDHVEVETYTWSVLPDAAGGDLVAGLAAELEWTRDRLLALGLEEVT